MSNGSAPPNGNLDLNIGKYSVHIGGRDTLIIVILALALAGLIYVDYMIGQNTRMQLSELEEEMRLQSWLLTLPQGDRPQIMPPAGAMHRILEQTRRGERGRPNQDTGGSGR